MLALTKVLAATDTLGTRVKAHSPLYGVSVVIPWDGRGGHVACHARAVAALCRKLNAEVDSEFRGTLDTLRMIGDAGKAVGYAFDVQPSAGPRRPSWVVTDDGVSCLACDPTRGDARMPAHGCA